jgi:hypothetical protein
MSDEKAKEVAHKTVTLGKTRFNAPVDGQGNLGTTIMLLAANDGFAPNVNVLTQMSGISAEEYMNISVAQMAQLGVTVTSTETNGDVMKMAYHGTLPDNPHEVDAYMKILKDGARGAFVLATATCLRSMATSEAPDDIACVQKMHACVDSLSLEPLQGESSDKVDGGAWNIDMLLAEEEVGWSFISRNGLASEVVIKGG